MNKNLIENLKQEYDKPFEGWNFCYLTDNNKMFESQLPWNYRKIVEEKFKFSESLLDMGTGGGEFLSSLNNLPEKTFATEGWKPNFIIAKKKLRNTNTVIKYIKKDEEIPFESNKFDLIINRHESFDSKEVFRILKPGGIFVTQQVGGLNDANLNSALDAESSQYLNWSLIKAVQQNMKAGFKIISQDENFGYTRFTDIGAVCYYLKCIPWQVPDFSVEKYSEKLILINNLMKKKGYIDLVNHRFLVISKKK